MTLLEYPPAPATGVETRLPRPARALMVVEAGAGGTGRHGLARAEGLIRRGCDVHVVYSTGRVDALFLAGLSRLPELRRLAMPMRTSVHPSDWSVVRTIRRYARE